MGGGGVMGRFSNVLIPVLKLRQGHGRMALLDHGQHQGQHVLDLVPCQCNVRASRRNSQA